MLHSRETAPRGRLRRGSTLAFACIEYRVGRANGARCAASVLWLSLMTSGGAWPAAQATPSTRSPRRSTPVISSRPDAAIDAALAQPRSDPADPRRPWNSSASACAASAWTSRSPSRRPRRRLRELIPDMTEQEFAGWKASNQLEHMVIDGVPYYFNRSVSNLFRVSPEATARRAKPATRNDGPMESANAVPRRGAGAGPGDRQDQRGAAPRARHAVDHRQCRCGAGGRDGTRLDSVPARDRRPAGRHRADLERARAKHAIAPESTLQRTVYLEQPAVAGDADEVLGHL